ncbi:MAG: hypothetical protein JNM77_09370 [Pseudonocardia sp.]|nr:hypothetical protein [Pseudonocardia sp.]
MTTFDTVRVRDTVRPPAPSTSPSGVRPRGGADAWRARRREVINQASGLCAVCGLAGADTAFRDWDADDLLAAHTRCVVGLGPVRTAAGERRDVNVSAPPPGDEGAGVPLDAAAQRPRAHRRRVRLPRSFVDRVKPTGFT